MPMTWTPESLSTVPSTASTANEIERGAQRRHRGGERPQPVRAPAEVGEHAEHAGDEQHPAGVAERREHERELAADDGGEAREAFVAHLLEEAADVRAAVGRAGEVHEPDREPGADERDRRAAPRPAW